MSFQRRFTRLCTAGLLAALTCQAPPALAVVVTFNDLIRGQTAYNFDGDNDGKADLRFSTIDPSGFNTVGPGSNMSFIREPGLEGSSQYAVDLRIDFLRGANQSVKFDFALNSVTPGPYGSASISVYDSQNRLLGSKTVAGNYTSTALGQSNFPEGQLSVSFNGLASYAKLNFDSQYGRYILDNFEAPAPSVYGVFVGVKDVGVAGDADARKMFDAVQKSFPGFKQGALITADLTTGGSIQASQIQSEIDKIAQKMRPGDSFIFFDSSHGGSYDTGVETTKTPGNEFLALGGTVTDNDLTAMLSGLNSFQKWVFLDACNTGGFWGDKNINEAGDLDKLNNIGLFAGSREDSFSYSNMTDNEGVFTGSIVDGLALDKDGFMNADKDRNHELTFEEMTNWIDHDWWLQLRQDPVSVIQRAQGDVVAFDRDLFKTTSLASADFTGSMIGGPVVAAGPVPEPSTTAMLLLGMTGLLIHCRRRH